MLFGVFTLRVQSERRGPMTATQITLGNANPAQLQQQALEHLQVTQQRLAEAMPDAAIQVSPDGSRMETYFDGMQVKQTFGGDRLVIHGPEMHVFSPPQPATFHGSSEPAAWVKVMALLFFIVLPIILLVAGHKRRKERGGANLLDILLVLLLMGGMTLPWFLGTRHVQVTQTPVVRAPAPKTGWVQGSQGRVAHAAPSPRTPQQSLEDLWERLFPLKIQLEAPETPAVNARTTKVPTAKVQTPHAPLAAPPSFSVSPDDAADQELVAAARMVLSRSMPGADPFTQGWLVNAAKAILDASAMASTNRAASKPRPEVAFAAASAGSTKHKSVVQSKSRPPVAPSHAKTELVTAKSRPSWVDDPPMFVGNARRVVAHTDPYSTVEECYDALRIKMRELVLSHIQERAQEVSPGHYAYVPSLDALRISDDYIKRELCPEEPYIETVESSVGDMLRAHMLLEFQDRQDEQLLDRWRAFARRANVVRIAAFGGFAVLGLGLIYGLLKIDTATRGYYTKRLFLGVPAAIIAVVVLLAFVS
jgi:hypothetical protein